MIVCADNLSFMALITDNSVDLTVTSPPYDNLRTYEGFSWNFEAVARELFRVTRVGGTVVWIVGDATNKGNETGTSFKQALLFREIGFNLHDTMIYLKGGQGATGSRRAYWQDFEYMFVLAKGRLRTFNPLEDRKNVVPPRVSFAKQGHRYKTGEPKPKRIVERKTHGRRTNVWTYHENGTRTSHPAVFPLQLAKDHILSWSNPGDLVFDPFLGSGTTALACAETGRNFIGCDLSHTYCNLACARLNDAR